MLESQLSGVPVESLKVNQLFPHFTWKLLTKTEHGCNGRMTLSMNADSSANSGVFSSNEMRNEKSHSIQRTGEFQTVLDADFQPQCHRFKKKVCPDMFVKCLLTSPSIFSWHFYPDSIETKYIEENFGVMLLRVFYLQSTTSCLCFTEFTKCRKWQNSQLLFDNFVLFYFFNFLLPFVYLSPTFLRFTRAQKRGAGREKEKGGGCVCSVEKRPRKKCRKE